MKEVDWPVPCGYTIFCDDIRQEISGKRTLVGVYGASMYVNAEYPVTFPQLSMVVHYMEDPDIELPPLILKVFLPDATEEEPSFQINLPKNFPTAQQRRDGEAQEDERGDGLRLIMTFPIQLGGVEIAKPGPIKVRMERGDELIRLGRLNVRQGEVPSPNQDTPAAV